MTDRTPEQIAEEAERILSSEVFTGAVKTVRDAAIAAMLAADGDDADRIRREKAHFVNAIDGVLAAIRTQFEVNKAQARPRGGVA